jgi:saccharopine dehydrogenase (NAD+, L-lysine-forming)
MGKIGIRKEDKSRYERRAPLAPEHVREATQQGVSFLVEPSPVRVFPEEAYEEAGATLTHDLSQADVIMGVKEIPLEKLLAGKAYLYFSHTIKGQEHNMPMLQRLMDLGSTLIDYEKIADDAGRRLVFFGYHAGLAGMIDGLWIFGKRLAEDGYPTPLAAIKQAFEYENLAAACHAIEKAGKAVAHTGLPDALPPMVFGFAGYGNVSRGAQYVFDHLPFHEVTPEELPGLFAPGAGASRKQFYKVVFKEEHIAKRRDGGPFELQEYFNFPERYEGIFQQWLPYLTGLVNCIYWEPRYPMLVTRKELQRLAGEGTLALRVVADITCDIDGSIEMTVAATTQDAPILTYDPKLDEVVLRTEGPGVSVLAVDNLPCELSVDATLHFGASLSPFLGELAALDRQATFDTLNVSPALRRAIIVWNGELTPDYCYLASELAAVR